MWILSTTSRYFSPNSPDQFILFKSSITGEGFAPKNTREGEEIHVHSQEPKGWNKGTHGRSPDSIQCTVDPKGQHHCGSHATKIHRGHHCLIALHQRPIGKHLSLKKNGSKRLTFKSTHPFKKRALPNRGPIFTHNLAIFWYLSCLCSYVVSLKIVFWYILHYSLNAILYLCHYASRKEAKVIIYINKCSGLIGLHSCIVFLNYTKTWYFHKRGKMGPPFGNFLFKKGSEM